MDGRTWSAQQEAIFGWFGSGAGNLVVRARAGTGKTTTILEGIGRAPGGKILLAAFNKRIAEELQTKVRNPAIEYVAITRARNELVWARKTIPAAPAPVAG